MLRNIFSSRQSELRFHKMSGGGNDFVVVDNRGGAVSDPDGFTKKICTRRLSVGADGVILIESSQRATFRMRYFNSDGSLADFCANGTRCAARFAFLNVIAPRKMTIETGAGVIAAEVVEQKVALSLPAPSRFEPQLPLEVDGRQIRGSFIVVGVPHYVVFMSESPWRFDIDRLGRAIRHHPSLAPEGANVNFIFVRDRGAIDVRTWERGVEGETLSCGSGVVASVAVSFLFDRVDASVAVRTRSGIILQAEISGNRERIEATRLTGDARVVYQAAVTPETVDGFDAEWVRSPTEGGEGA